MPAMLVRTWLTTRLTGMHPSRASGSALSTIASERQPTAPKPQMTAYVQLSNASKLPQSAVRPC